MRSICLSLTLTVAACLCLWGPLAQAAEPIGLVKSAEGKATAFRDGKSTPLKAGDDLFKNDQLATDGQGALGLVLRDDTTLSLGPNSKLVLDDFVFDPAADKLGLNMRMAKGTFSVLTGQIAKLAPERTSIRTPVATIGIRGTRFLVEVEGGSDE
ncbi:MAG: FecR domain-containing protein [Alphaproteobacteria bacterium]|nr:FecR domain-containing protein [Alphaproteobacteria bacterium]